MKPRYHAVLWPAVAVLLLDQLSKFVVVRTMALHSTISVIEGFFNLVHVRNRGMAFGFLNRPDMEFGFYILVTASIVAIALLLFWSLRLGDENQKILPGLSLIMGGAMGNLIDRVRLREVIDFLDFHVGSYHWPAFNVADSAITLGTIWVVFVLIFRGKSTSQA